MAVEGKSEAPDMEKKIGREAVERDSDKNENERSVEAEKMVKSEAVKVVKHEEENGEAVKVVKDEKENGEAVKVVKDEKDNGEAVKVVKDEGKNDEVVKEKEKEIEIEIEKEKESVVDEKKKETNGDEVVSDKTKTGFEIKNLLSFKDDKNRVADLKEYEKKALSELKMKVEEAILGNKLFNKKKEKKEKEKEKKESSSSAKHNEQQDQKDKASESNVNGGVEEKENSKEVEADTKTTSQDMHAEKQVVEETERSGEGPETEVKTDHEKEDSKGKEIAPDHGEGKLKEAAIVDDQGEKEKNNASSAEKINGVGDDQEELSQEEVVEEGGVVDKDIAIWGIPLLPSKGDTRTDVVLTKFLRAREFRVNEAFEMLRNTMQWRRENKIDSILEENFETELASAGYMDGKDREGHPVCYNNFGVLNNDDLYGKILGNEIKYDKLLRWRIQLMEKGIQKLDFDPDGISTILQISDLKNAPLPTKTDFRLTARKLAELLQDNYPEFVFRNVFINVPFWYFAFSAFLTPFLTQRTKNKFVSARSSRVTEVLLKYVGGEQIPVEYGGLKRNNDSEFSVEDSAEESLVKAGSTETIEIPAPEVGKVLIWDLTVCGWDVHYKEEFVPTDEESYTIIVQKGRKITMQEGTIRNSFKNKEPGKLVITIENGAFNKKKRILYRYKTKDLSSTSSSSS
ncbi:hypothetical protein K2173_012101 [Erythroxylum novogranatense]|uniref:Patellin-4 n=1 Tax=Erythroxylum novogranatense TaxID=1862640 RepID=A0AAV8TH96_9ROSI|nr:hypothetical protein K2173_012101 [Erythroxylum novogranatense]